MTAKNVLLRSQGLRFGARAPTCYATDFYCLFYGNRSNTYRAKIFYNFSSLKRKRSQKFPRYLSQTGMFLQVCSTNKNTHTHKSQSNGRVISVYSEIRELRF